MQQTKEIAASQYKAALAPHQWYKTSTAHHAQPTVHRNNFFTSFILCSQSVIVMTWNIRMSSTYSIQGLVTEYA